MFEFNETVATATTGNTGSKVLSTGVYKMNIETVSFVTAKTGTKGVDISFKIEGGKYPNMIYGVWYEKANGDKINMGNAIIQNLVGLTGGKVTVYDKTIDVKDGKKVVKAIKECDGFEGYIAVVKVHDVYNGEVREKNEARAFMNVEKKTYAESKSNSEPKQYKYYSENLKDVETSAFKKFKLDTNDVEEENEEGGSLL